MKSLWSAAWAAFAFLTGSMLAAADDLAAPPLPVLYVGKFEPIEHSPEGFGPLHAINADIRHAKADRNAARLSSALIAALRTHAATAATLAVDASMPQPPSGWLIQGVFYALDENSHLVSVPLISTQKGPNVEVSVTITDLGRDSRVPFAVLGTDAAFKGQGTALSWNPYVAAAKFVVHQTQGHDSIAALADQIAQKILDEGRELLAHDPSARVDASNR